MDMNRVATGVGRFYDWTKKKVPDYAKRGWGATKTGVSGAFSWTSDAIYADPFRGGAGWAQNVSNASALEKAWYGYGTETGAPGGAMHPDLTGRQGYGIFKGKMGLNIINNARTLGVRGAVIKPFATMGLEGLMAGVGRVVERDSITGKPIGSKWFWGKSSMGHIGFLGRAFAVAGLIKAAHAGWTGWDRGGMIGAAGGVAGEALTMAKDFAMFGLADSAVSIVTGGAVSLGAVLPPVMAVMAVGASVGAGAYGYYKWNEYLAGQHTKLRTSEFVGPASMYRAGQAYSMRAAALQEINRSQLNARSLLGQEAAYMHG